jgi:DNA-binding NarL/FixJ family response regulator
MAMPKRVLNVGQCDVDHSGISQFLEKHFDVDVEPAHRLLDTMQKLRSGQFTLVLVNRKLDADDSDGIEIIKTIKADAELADVSVMLVSNFADAHQQAVAVGAEYGFGKAEYDDPAVIERLKGLLT